MYPSPLYLSDVRESKLKVVNHDTSLITQELVEPTDVYVDAFIRRKSAGDMLETRAFKSSEEMSIAMAVYKALCRMGENMNAKDTCFIVVGERGRPFVGTFLAFNSKGEVCSVSRALDPFYARDAHVKARQLTIELDADALEGEPNLIKRLVFVVLQRAWNRHITGKAIRNAYGMVPSIGLISLGFQEDPLLNGNPTYQYIDMGCKTYGNVIRCWREINNRRGSSAGRALAL